jgi:hypothetical protein
MRQWSRHPDGKPVGQVRDTLTEYLLKRENWTTALSLTEQGQKTARRRKIPRIKKSYSLLLQVTMQMGQVEVEEDDDEREPVEPITSPCDSVSGTEG